MVTSAWGDGHVRAGDAIPFLGLPWHLPSLMSCLGVRTVFALPTLRHLPVILGCLLTLNEGF